MLYIRNRNIVSYNSRKHYQINNLIDQNFVTLNAHFIGLIKTAPAFTHP